MQRPRGEEPTEQTGLDGVVQHLVDPVNLLIRRGVQHDDDTPDQAYCTAQLPQRSQCFFQEICSQHRTVCGVCQLPKKEIREKSKKNQEK